MKLSTGREIELKPVTIEQRIKCNDAAVVEYKADGGVVIRDAFRALVAWAEAGTGLTLEQLGAYTDAEIREIGQAVKEAATLSPLPPSS